MVVVREAARHEEKLTVTGKRAGSRAGARRDAQGRRREHIRQVPAPGTPGLLQSRVMEDFLDTPSNNFCKNQG